MKSEGGILVVAVGPSSMTVKYSCFVNVTELSAKRAQGNLGK